MCGSRQRPFSGESEAAGQMSWGRGNMGTGTVQSNNKSKGKVKAEITAGWWRVSGCWGLST